MSDDSKIIKFPITKKSSSNTCIINKEENVGETKIIKFRPPDNSGPAQQILLSEIGEK